jgi:IS30 family transposase
MGRCHEHLSLGERARIEVWRVEGRSLRWIGARLGRPASTISRELRRNGRRTRQWAGSYDGERAHVLALRRRRWDARFKLARQPHLRVLVRDGLAMGRSPEQIAGRLAREHGRTLISHESIYRFVYHRSAQKDYWHRRLLDRLHQGQTPAQRQARRGRDTCCAGPLGSRPPPSLGAGSDGLLALWPDGSRHP